MLHHYKITSQPFYYLHTSTCLIYTDSHTANDNNNKSLSGVGSDGMSMSSVWKEDYEYSYLTQTSLDSLTMQ